MSKIIEFPKTKPIRCMYCGCLYEYEQGDRVEVEGTQLRNRCGSWVYSENLIKLPCPVCGNGNTLVFEDKGDEKDV